VRRLRAAGRRASRGLRALARFLGNAARASRIDRGDVLFGAGLLLIGAGLAMEHAPAALYVPGGLIVAVVILGGLRAGAGRGE